MKYRCIGKFTIAIGINNYKGIIDAIKNVSDKLSKLNIRFKLYLKRRLIVTSEVIIRFIFKKHHYRNNRNIYNVRANGCYGFSDIETYTITQGRNKCKNCGLIDYILEKSKEVV